jgi:ArsR family transcriptional regulator
MNTMTAAFESIDLGTAARMFHALGDETRLRILVHLRDGECCVCDLTDACGAAQSRLSYHLRILKEAGILRDRRDGRWSYYCIEPAAEEVASNLVRLFTAQCGEAGCCVPEDMPAERAAEPLPETKERTT